MSPPGRPKGESLSAQREGSPVSPPGRPKGESLSAQREGSPASGALLWAAQAWIDGRWQADVLLRAGADGRWAEVRVGVPAPADARRLPGPVLPGLVDAHSHAFQRAFAAFAETRDGGHDDFWSWRDRMYRVALRIGPAQLRAVAAQLYAELLAGGFTQVCEFHYIHHDTDGQPYDDRLTLCRALVQAAQDAGIGLTLLPVLYERAGFAEPRLRPDQRRFGAGVEHVLALRDGVRGWGLPRIDAGVAIHSLRAATPEAIARLARACADDAGPIHIHVAEQTGEVDACVQATGQRPVAWLAAHVPLDPRWHLVHATHTVPAEVDAVARSGAGVVICPATEANLGDGLADLPGWLTQGVEVAVGTDSHTCRSAAHELRLLEYGQRLALRRRNVAAAPERGVGATAARLFDSALRGGARAAGLGAWGLVEGAPADLAVIDGRAPGLLGVPAAHWLDALVFATDAPALAEVWVAGQRVLADGRHVRADALADGFDVAVRALMA